MVRPVWHSQRYSEADTNETLQSDVMRFMAILALCLVAIFALVQSLPLRPIEPLPAPPAAVDEVTATPQSVIDPPAALPMPVPTAPLGVDELKHEQPPQPMPKLDEPVVEQPTESKPVTHMPEPVAEVPTPLQLQDQKITPVQEQPSSPETAQLEQPQPVPDESVTTAAAGKQEGLSLRFASDSALLALVAKGRVDVYGWVENTAWRLLSERGLLSFVSAPVPKRFHSMTSETVPKAILHSLNSTLPGMHASAITWGVTLPRDTTRQLEHLVNKHRSGTLVIHANGRVRFESAG